MRRSRHQQRMMRQRLQGGEGSETRRSKRRRNRQPARRESASQRSRQLKNKTKLAENKVSGHGQEELNQEHRRRTSLASCSHRSSPRRIPRAVGPRRHSRCWRPPTGVLRSRGAPTGPCTRCRGTSTVARERGATRAASAERAAVRARREAADGALAVEARAALSGTIPRSAARSFEKRNERAIGPARKTESALWSETSEEPGGETDFCSLRLSILIVMTLLLV